MKKRILSMLLAIVMVVGLMPGVSLTAFAADDSDPTAGGPRITGYSFNDYSLAYDAQAKVFYVSDDFPFYLVVTGENLNEVWPWVADNHCAVFYDSYINTGVYMGMSVASDGTSASIMCNTASLFYAIGNIPNNNGRGIDSIVIGDQTLEITLKYAPTYSLTVLDPDHGEVSTGRGSNEIPEYAEVTLTVTPDNGYELDELEVYYNNMGTKYLDVTKETDGRYTFTMPAYQTVVNATFKETDVTATDYTGTYDGRPHSITVNAPDGARITYSNGNGTYDTANPTYTDAGEYTVYYEVVKADNSVVTGNAEVRIAPLDISAAEVTLGNALTYNGNVQTQTVAKVKVGDLTVDADSYTVTGNTATNAGAAYELTVTAKDNSNFTGSVKKGFSVAQKKVTVTADNKKAYVGGRQPGLTYTVVGLVGSDKLTTAPAVTTNADMSRVGKYTIKASGADAGSNYTISYVNGTLSVERYSYIPIVPPKYSVEIADDIACGDVSADKELAYNGDTVTITVAPHAGYGLTALTVTDSRNNAITVTKESDTKYTFEMPGYDVEIDAEFAKLYTLCPRDWTCPMYGYTDLDRNAWYHDGIHFCIENGLMIGIAANTFAPDMTTSRAMLVTVLWRLEGEPVVDYAMPFEDVAADAWYTEAVRWAASEGIVLGYSDKAFGPNDVITREQFATIIYRYEQYKGGGFTGMWMIRMDYADLAEVSDWAYEAMCWMNMNGVVNGKPGDVLDPNGSATRAEAAAMIQRYCGVMTK